MREWNWQSHSIVPLLLFWTWVSQRKKHVLSHPASQQLHSTTSRTNWPILMSAKCHFIIKASPSLSNWLMRLFLHSMALYIQYIRHTVSDIHNIHRWRVSNIFYNMPLCYNDLLLKYAAWIHLVWQKKQFSENVLSSDCWNDKIVSVT